MKCKSGGSRAARRSSSWCKDALGRVYTRVFTFSNLVLRWSNLHIPPKLWAKLGTIATLTFCCRNRAWLLCRISLIVLFFYLPVSFTLHLLRLGYRTAPRVLSSQCTSFVIIHGIYRVPSTDNCGTPPASPIVSFPDIWELNRGPE